MKTLNAFVIATLAAFGAGGTLAYAKNGADDPVSHLSGGNGGNAGLFASNGAGDTSSSSSSSHASGGKGADDPAGHVSGGNGVDDPAGKVDDRGRPVGEARNGADDRGTTISRLVDDNPHVSGSLLDYRARKGNRQFKTGLKIKLPDDRTGITRSNAKKALITASISNGGVVYAECELAFDHFLPGNRAEYKVEVSERLRGGKTRLQQSRGSCDTNLTQAGVQAGVPSVKTGDDIVLELEKENAVYLEISKGKL